MPWNLEDKVKWTELTPSLQKKFKGVEDSANSIAKFGSDQLSNARLSVSKVTPIAPLNNYDLWIDEKYRIGRAFTEDNWEFTRAAWANGSGVPSNPPASEGNPPPPDGGVISSDGNTETYDPSKYNHRLLTIVSFYDSGGGVMKRNWDQIYPPVTMNTNPDYQVIEGVDMKLYLLLDFADNVTLNKEFGSLFVGYNKDVYYIPIKTTGSKADSINSIMSQFPTKNGINGKIKICATLETAEASLRDQGILTLLPCNPLDIRYGCLSYPGYPYHFHIGDFVDKELSGNPASLNVPVLVPPILKNSYRFLYGGRTLGDPPFTPSYSNGFRGLKVIVEGNIKK